MRSITFTVSALFAALMCSAGVESSRSGIHARAGECALPKWTISDLSVTYSSNNSGDNAAKTTFTVTNTVTNATETLSCRLPFNSHCEMYGTPEDENLTVMAQFYTDTAYISVNETMSCGDDADVPQYAVAMLEMSLVCPEERSEDMTCTGEGGTIEGELSP